MLSDSAGNRKYMIQEEWRRFVASADLRDPDTRSLCWMFAWTGARVSELLSLTPRSFDISIRVIKIRTLKRRQLVYRELPLDDGLFSVVQTAFDIVGRRDDPCQIDAPLWSWCRTTAWGRVKSVGLEAGLPEYLCMPKVLRHTYAFEGANTQGLPLGLVQELLGHARIESTLVYTTPRGRDARLFTDRMFRLRGVPSEPASTAF
jgi:integrase/recombinase XerD